MPPLTEIAALYATPTVAGERVAETLRCGPQVFDPPPCPCAPTGGLTSTIRIARATREDGQRPRAAIAATGRERLGDMHNLSKSSVCSVARWTDACCDCSH